MTARKRAVLPFVKKIEFHKRKIAEHRDALRGLVDDAEAVVESCDRASLALIEALDALSEYL